MMSSKPKRQSVRDYKGDEDSSAALQYDGMEASSLICDEDRQGRY